MGTLIISSRIKEIPTNGSCIVLPALFAGLPMKRDELRMTCDPYFFVGNFLVDEIVFEGCYPRNILWGSKIAEACTQGAVLLIKQVAPLYMDNLASKRTVRLSYKA